MYLLVNLPDVSFGQSPLMSFIRPELGDNLLSGTWIAGSELDDLYLAVETTPARVEAIRDGLNLYADKKRIRRVRTKTPKNLPKTVIPD